MFVLIALVQLQINCLYVKLFFFSSIGSGLRAHEGLNVTDEGEIFWGNIISVIEFQGRVGDVRRAQHQTHRHRSHP